MSEPALLVERLSVRFRDEAAAAVQDVSLTLAPGEIVAVVGESGSGKSMLGFALARLTPPEALVSAKRIVVGGENLTEPSPAQLARVRGRRIAYVFQEPLTALSPTRRLGDQMADALQALAPRTRAEAWEQGVRLLEEVQVRTPQDAAQRHPHQLSGGMRQRALIALAFAGAPALVVADEVTTAIDSVIRRDVLALMTDKARASGAAILLISHDLDVVADFSSRAIVMYRGQIVEEGPSAELMSAPKHPYTQMLVASLPARSPPRTPLPVSRADAGETASAGCAFRARCPQAIAACGAVQELRALGPERRVRCGLAA